MQVGAPLRPVTVRDAIGDLPAIENGHSVEEMEYVSGPVSCSQGGTCKARMLNPIAHSWVGYKRDGCFKRPLQKALRTKSPAVLLPRPLSMTRLDPQVRHTCTCARTFDSHL